MFYPVDEECDRNANVSEPFPSNEGRYFGENNDGEPTSDNYKFQNLFLLMKVATNSWIICWICAIAFQNLFLLMKVAT